MPVYKWDELKEYPITPSHSVAKGKTLYGNMIFIQKLKYKGDRGDGKTGATLHCHPEEQFIIRLKGTQRFQEGGQWYEAEPGDVVHIPANSEHQGYLIDGDEGLTYQIKVRVPGHSFYDLSWQPGSKEEWEEHFRKFNEMSKKYHERLPWNI